MVVLERRESEGTVVFRVFIIADADERGIEQGNDQGDDLVLGQAAPVQVLVAAFANDGQLCRERQHAVELGLPSQLRPDGVVQVLATPLLVDPGRLQVPAGITADPHRLPGRRDPQLLDTLKMFFGGDSFCMMIDVNMRLGLGFSDETGLGRAGVEQPRLLGGLDRVIGGCCRFCHESSSWRGLVNLLSYRK